MKKVVSTVLTVLLVMISFSACSSSKVEKIEGGLRFCESVLEYGDGLLIANFGSSVLDPLNNENKGYIMYYDGSVLSEFIPASGHLSAPKGMAVIGDWLWVADVNKTVIFNVNDRTADPIVINFPEGEMFVNHLVQVGDMMLISVTNTGNIFAVPVDAEGKPQADSLDVYINVPGANGLLFNNGTLYIASYSPDGIPTEANVIYAINDLAAPIAQPMTDRIGQYDGLALNGDYLYFTDWINNTVGKLNVVSGDIEIIPTDPVIAGPAEIDIYNERLCVPDLANSVVYMYHL